MFFYFKLYSKQNEAKITNGFKGSAKRQKRFVPGDRVGCARNEKRPANVKRLPYLCRALRYQVRKWWGATATLCTFERAGSNLSRCPAQGAAFLPSR